LLRLGRLEKVALLDERPCSIRRLYEIFFAGQDDGRKIVVLENGDTAMWTSDLHVAARTVCALFVGNMKPSVANRIVNFNLFVFVVQRKAPFLEMVRLIDSHRLLRDSRWGIE
jgi:hypothetical protein